jgi:hypothetical protein
MTSLTRMNMAVNLHARPKVGLALICDSIGRLSVGGASIPLMNKPLLEGFDLASRFLLFCAAGRS